MGSNLHVPPVKTGDWESVKRAIRILASPRVLGPDATPTFAGLIMTGLTASRLVATDSEEELVSVTSASLGNYIIGTANQIIIDTSADDGTITLTTPQDIHTGASPTFAGLTLTGDLIPGTDDAYDLGSTTKQWKNLYVDGIAFIDDFSIIGAEFIGSIVPKSDHTYHLGSSSKYWNDLYLKGSLKNGADILSVAQARAAYDHVSNDGSDHSLLGATAGTVSASLAVIVDSNKDIDFDGGDITTTGWGRFDGGLFIGVAPSEYYGVRVNPSYTGVYYEGLNILPTFTPTASVYGYGVQFKMQLGDTAQNLATFGGCLGGFSTGNDYSGTVANAFCYKTQAAIGANAIVTTAKLIHITNPNTSVGYSLGTLYGLYLDDMTKGTANYSIYSAGGQSVHAGNLKIGSTTAPSSLLEVGDDTNDTLFSSTGVQTMQGTARVKKEIIVGAGDFHKGSSAPDDVYLGNGIHVLAFDKTTVEHGHFEMIIPQDFAAGTTIDIELDWAFDVVEADHYATWVVEYLLLADGEDPAGAITRTYQKSVISTGNNDKQIHATFGTGITGAVVDDTLLIRFFRDSNATYDTDDLDQDAWLLAFHLHYTADKLGEAL